MTEEQLRDKLREFHDKFYEEYAPKHRQKMLDLCWAQDMHDCPFYYEALHFSALIHNNLTNIAYLYE